MEKSLLLVVDVQNGFVNSNTKHILPTVRELVQSWHEQERGQVVFSRFINLPNSPWQRVLDWHKLTNEPETSLHPSLETKNAQVFKKGTYSAWSPEVRQVCDGSGYAKVYICGIDTDQCVLETAIDVFEANLVPLVIEDCCASSAGTKFHEAAVMLLERLIGKRQIVNSKDIL